MFIKNNFQGVVPAVSLNDDDKRMIAAVRGLSGEAKVWTLLDLKEFCRQIW